MKTSTLRLAPDLVDLASLGADCFEDLMGWTEGLVGAARAELVSEGSCWKLWRVPLPGTPDDSGKVTEAPKEPALTLLSSATVLGEYTEESEVALNEDNKTFTVKMSGAMRFYKLRSIRETKLTVTSLRLQGDNAVIAYEVVEE